MSKNIKDIIDKLGYNLDNGLIYFDKIIDSNLSYQDKRAIISIAPYAIYCIGNKPIVIFCEKNTEDKFKLQSKRIWNAQIPLAFFVDVATITIFSGNTLKDEALTKLCLIKNEEVVNTCEFSFLNINSTNYWERIHNNFPNSNLHESLLSNLDYIRNKLKRTFDIEVATQFVLRIIFIRFLIDRGVSIGFEGLDASIEQSKNNFIYIVKDKNKLYKLFNYLKTKFNGNLFDSIDTETIVDDNILNDVSDFLAGNINQTTGQLSLFSMYDFNIIPVELISNIYEILIGRAKQTQDKAFYTPRYLVDFIFHSFIDETLDNVSGKKILDPSCGSGIFLVEYLRRLIEKDGNYDEENLISIIKDNIFGIDKNKEAINVTIFSLYLTLLDYKDPKTLTGFNLPNLLGTNLIDSDFFDDYKTDSLKKIKFDYIIGNPPWGNIKGLHKNYCLSNNIPNPNNEISRSFIFRTREFIDANGICCFVLPSKILYNVEKKAADFRKVMLKNLSISDVVEISSVRKLIFKNATAPACIIKYKHQSNLDNVVKHLSLKPNIYFKLFNRIIIEKNDIKKIPQSTLLQYDWTWKLLVYGNVWDFEIIKNLFQNYESLGSIIRNNSLIQGTGILDNLGDANPVGDLYGREIIDSKCIKPYQVDDSSLEKFLKRNVHRTRNKELYTPPYVLTTTGIDTGNYKMKAAYSEKQFIYKRAISGIKGSMAQKDLLLCITGFMNSSLYAYINLMTGSSVGIEREQLILKEVMKFPFIFDKKVSIMVENIQSKLSVENIMFNDVSHEIEILDKYILSLFRLEDNCFVDYGISIQIPELTTYIKNYRSSCVTNDDMEKYIKVFSEYFDKKLENIGKKIIIKYETNIKNAFSICKFIIDDKNTIEENVIKKAIFESLIIHRINDYFYKSFDIIQFEDNAFTIYKSNLKKNWHESRAHIDLGEVINAIIGSKRGV